MAAAVLTTLLAVLAVLAVLAAVLAFVFAAAVAAAMVAATGDLQFSASELGERSSDLDVRNSDVRHGISLQGLLEFKQAFSSQAGKQVLTALNKDQSEVYFMKFSSSK
jgi:hypothetical protein